MSAIYFAIPTHVGQAKISNALALGVPLKITHMAVGDGNGQPVTPDPAQTKLVRERRRAPLNALFQDPLNPAQLVAQQIIPENEGGWWIHEIGLFDESGTMIAIANAPPTYKPQMSEGSGRTQGINVVLIVSDTSAVELKIDPSVVLATRKYADDVMKAHKESRDHPDASETAKGFTRYATQAEVNETAADNQKADAVVTVKTLWGWVIQGSELVRGMFKTATQSQVDAGTADDVVLTPKKARNGFSMVATTGAMALRLPSWLGGWLIQGGTGAPSGGLATITFPISYPAVDSYVALFGHRQSVLPTGLQSTVIDESTRTAGSMKVKQFYFDSNGIITGQSNFFWFCFGKGI
ncbi:phage tail protein [Aeromonas jandaei]|uniref:phage tail protein n=1 Tax=Aeromonas jandaei TaxID=650 RepID=UPI00191F5837|nr:phage tail protein [Aeromonas jandaei]MBL0609576.1 phage tail protein [Aeromonas jandaei]